MTMRMRKRAKIQKRLVAAVRPPYHTNIQNVRSPLSDRFINLVYS